MRIIILSLLMSCLFLGTAAQEYNVSTEIQPKNVLLEEFTGIRCGYCPEGHQKAEELKLILGNRLSIVAIHCGYFASAGPYEPDFEVQAGIEIGHFLGGSYGSFPSGAVNRRDWQGESTYPYSRGLWKGYARQIAEETAPVNLWGKAQIDARTRELTLEVQGYFTENVEGESPRLNVMLTQNNVLGLQYGGGMGDKYPHQHMLRAALSNAVGDDLPARQKGEYFTRKYTYVLPEAYKDIAVDMAELELVVFVTCGQYDVLNTITVKPDYVGEDLPLKAVISSHKIEVNDGYRYHFVPVMLTNRSNVVLTSAQFDVTLNGVLSRSEWKGEVAPFATEEIRVPVDWGTTAVKSNSYRIAMVSVNGQPVDGGAIEGNFWAPAMLPVDVILRINTDENAAENTYCLYDMDGKVVKTFGPFKNGEIQHYEEKLSLQPNTTYCLEITDAWGNGVYVHGNAIEFVNDAGLGLLMLTAIQNFGNRMFFTTDVPSGVESVQRAVNEVELYDIMGHRVQTAADEAAVDYSRLAPGVYVLRAGKTTRKIIVK